MATWTIEQEMQFKSISAQENELMHKRIAMQKGRHEAGCAVVKAIADANNTINGFEPLLRHLHDHGAELIDLIKPFVRRSEQ